MALPDLEPHTVALLVLVLQTATVFAALVGVIRLERLRVLADDARLRRLSWFFGLFAAAVAMQILLTSFHFAFAGPGPGPGGFRQRPPQWPLLLHHGLMIAALVVAVRAFGSPLHRKPGSGDGAAGPAAALLLFGPFGLLRLVEAGLTLYLAIVTAVNQRRRGTKGSLRVAAGFFLFFLGHLSFWVFQPDRGPRPFWAEALSLLGILLLVASVPRRTA